MIKSSYPEIKVEYANAENKQWTDVTEHCVQFMSQSNINNSFTTFNAMFKKTFPVPVEEIKPNDMFNIYLRNRKVDYDEEFYPIVTPGFVNRAQDSFQINPGQIQDNIVIQGMDIGKYLMKTSVLYYPFVHLGGEPYRPLEDLKLNDVLTAREMRPDFIAKELIQHLLFNQFQELVNGSKIEDYLDITNGIESLTDKSREGQEFNFELLDYDNFFFQQGPLWQMLKTYSNPLLNEIFLRPTIIQGSQLNSIKLRRRPFNSTTFPNAWWDMLSADHDVSFENSEIISSALGRSDDDVYNFWLVSNPIGGLNNQEVVAVLSGAAEKGGVKLPVFDNESAKKYGVRPYIQSTPFVPIYNQKDTGIMFEAMSILTQRVFEWYCLNDRFKNGTLQLVAGKPEAYIGMGMVNIDTQENYYIEGVSHNWVPGRLSSTLQVTRGIVMDGPEGYEELKQAKLEQVGLA